MKVFFKEQVLPFLLVCVTVVGLTVACYGLPKEPPPKPLAIGTRFSPVQNQQREDALVRAIDVLRGARSQAESTLPPRTKPAAKVAASPARGRNPNAPQQAPGASPIAMGGTVVPAGMPAEPSLSDPPSAATIAPVMAAVTSLSEAVKSIRSARTEEDFLRAENQMRTVKTQLQAACTSGASSAFCDSAKEIDSLGF